MAFQPSFGLCPGTPPPPCHSRMLASSPIQLCWQGRHGAPANLHHYLASEKPSLLGKGNSIHIVGVQTKHVHFVAVHAVSQQMTNAVFEEIKVAESGSPENLGETGLAQTDSNAMYLPQPEVQAPPALSENVPSNVEFQNASSPESLLSEPLLSTYVTPDVPSGGGGSPMDVVSSPSDAGQLYQDPDFGSLKSSAEASINAAAGAGDASQEAAKVAGDTVLNVEADAIKNAEDTLSSVQNAVDSDALPSVMNSATDTVFQTSKAVSDALEDTKSSISDALGTSREAILNLFSKVQDSIQSSVSGAGNAVKSAYDNVNGSIVNSIKKVTGPFEKFVPDLGSAQENAFDLTSPFRMGTPANNALKEAVAVVESAAGAALAAGGKLAVEVYGTTKAALPLDAQSFLDVTEKKTTELAAPVGSALQQAYVIITDAERAIGVNPENPIVPIILVIGGTVFVGLSYWQSRYGGYSGDLVPSSALSSLQEENNVLLVDVRPEVLRENEGIPDLRRQARYKFASVETFKVQGTIRRLLQNANDIDYVITAAIIRNLKNVEPKTKVIVMDADGSQSKKLARALKKSGIKMPYRIEGGFKAWLEGGLRVKQLGIDTPLTFIKEETEAILEDVKPTPIGVLSIVLGATAGVYALIEWEKTLQLLGLIGLAQVLYTRLNSYESVDDMKADLRMALRPFTLATQGILWIAGQVEPSKLQLATSPSTSAVQDRVLQAAAKHGPLPSELEQQQESQTSDELIAEENAPTSLGIEGPVQ